jgi:hypothetical protein
MSEAASVLHRFDHVRLPLLSLPFCATQDLVDLGEEEEEEESEGVTKDSATSNHEDPAPRRKPSKILSW